MFESLFRNCYYWKKCLSVLLAFKKAKYFEIITDFPIFSTWENLLNAIPCIWGIGIFGFGELTSLVLGKRMLYVSSWGNAYLAVGELKTIEDVLGNWSGGEEFGNQRSPSTVFLNSWRLKKWQQFSCPKSSTECRRGQMEALIKDVKNLLNLHGLDVVLCRLTVGGL